MRNFRVFDFIHKHFQENFWLYATSILCISTGIILGIYTVKYMSEVQKSDLVNYFVSFTEYLKTTEVNRNYILFETVKNNLPVFIALWLLGFTIIGIPVILVIDVIKGFTIGFTMTFMINGIGIEGIWISLAGVIPQNIIYVPCTIFASAIAMEFSLVKLRAKFNSSGIIRGSNQYMSYTITFLIVVLLCFFGFITEAYFSPIVLRLIIK